MSTPPDYVIGAEDVLIDRVLARQGHVRRRDVRPDGKISLPLLNDVAGGGLTPEQLRLQLTKLAAKLIEEPNVTVVVKAINSRKVFVTGQVGQARTVPAGRARRRCCR